MSKEAKPTAADIHPGQVSPHFYRHVRAPQNLGKLEQADGTAIGTGVCGDSLEVQLRIVGNRLMDVMYVPDGCIYTVVCASAMSKLAKGLTVEQALNLQPEDVETELGGIPKDHRHCARLAVNTLGEAITDYYAKLWRSNQEDSDGH